MGLSTINSLPKLVLECGLNHNGHLSLAFDIINMCANAAENTGYPFELIYIKFQKRNPEISTPEHMKLTQRVSPHDNKVKTYIEYKHDVEFGLREYNILSDYARDTFGHLNIFVSVWDLDSVDFVARNFHHWPYIKIPSAHLTNHDLLIAAAKTGIPLIISTGMSTYDEIESAYNAQFGVSSDLTILSCTAIYPCPDEQINFYKLKELKIVFGTDHKIGFSSHSPSPYPAIYSNFYNVDMIEVHVTTDRSLPGSDQGASLEQPGLELLMRETLRIPKLYGDGRFIYDSELEKRKSLRGY